MDMNYNCQFRQVITSLRFKVMCMNLATGCYLRAQYCSCSCSSGRQPTIRHNNYTWMDRTRTTCCDNTVTLCQLHRCSQIKVSVKKTMQNLSSFFNRLWGSCNIHSGQNQEEDGPCRLGTHSPRTQTVLPPPPPAGATEPCTQKHPFVRAASSAAAVTLVNCILISTVYWRPIQPPVSLRPCCCDAIIYFHCLIYVSIIQKDANSRTHLCCTSTQIHQFTDSDEPAHK